MHGLSSSGRDGLRILHIQAWISCRLDRLPKDPSCIIRGAENCVQRPLETMQQAVVLRWECSSFHIEIPFWFIIKTCLGGMNPRRTPLPINWGSDQKWRAPRTTGTSEAGGGGGGFCFYSACFCPAWSFWPGKKKSAWAKTDTKSRPYDKLTTLWRCAAEARPLPSKSPCKKGREHGRWHLCIGT